ncbi:ABC transporter permease [Microbacterium rhizomatis]|nr:FtsX-like permease family protein [Microbacterium rhizomatis]
MIIAVMLTTGRTVAAEQQVLGTIDSAGTRSITVRAEQDAGITSDVLDRISHIDGIEWSGAFSSAIDATNTLIPDGTRVPARYVYGTHFDRLGVPRESPVPGALAFASPVALEQLGMLDPSGSITLTTGVSYGIAGELTVPDFLTELQPLMLIPQPDVAGTEPVNVIIVIAESPELVAPVSDAVLSVLAPTDPTKVTVQTSRALAELRALIQGQLGSYSRGLVLALMALTGALVAILLYGLVMMRRKDYGRRRALGATRGLIITLLVTQTGILALTGIALGTGTSLLILAAGRAPLPGVAFTAALAILALTTALIAALLPALVASRREPIRELRVP